MESEDAVLARMRHGPTRWDHYPAAREVLNMYTNERKAMEPVDRDGNMVPNGGAAAGARAVQLGRRMAAAMADSPYACLALPDEAGRIRVKVEVVGGRPVVHVYGYDVDGRLAEVRRNGEVTERYEYDGQGRRSRDHGSERHAASRNHEYGPDDRLLRAGDTTFTYDAMGRLERLKEPGHEDLVCVYTSLGFLGGARLPDMRWVSYDRDGDGRRTAKLVNNVKTEGFGWDKQGRLLWFFDVASGHTCWFEYADAQARLPLSMQRGGERYKLGWDHVGSLRAVIDAKRGVVKEVAYDAFGNILRETAPEFKMPFGFAGGLYDRDTQLIRYRFRDYLPDVGRFTAKDPIGYKGGDSDLYGYCLDDPVNLVDPSGLGAVLLNPNNGSSSLVTHDHSALLVCRDDQSECVLYDPAGSYYEAMGCGSSQRCYGEAASVQSYADWLREASDKPVDSLPIPLTPEESDQLYEKVESMPPVEDAQCTIAVSEALRGVGIFQDLDSYFWPNSLRKEIERRLREND